MPSAPPPPTPPPTAPPGTTASTGSDAELVDAALDALAVALPLPLFADGMEAASAAGRLARAALLAPGVMARNALSLGAELTKVALGVSAVAPEPGDKRWADEAWKTNPVYRRVGQSYLAWRRSAYDLVEHLDLDDETRLRSRFVAAMAVEAAAPTNTLPGNPAALKEAVRTRGASLAAGARNAVDDLLHNGAMPATVDRRPFVVGETLAVTPGAVVFRNEVLELLHYQPRSEQVHERPLLVVPPQINRFYVTDLAPGRSLVEHALAQGQQVFMVSWRNPGREQRDWDLDTYCEALLEASDAVLEITGQRDLNVLGVCAGGITVAALVGSLQSIGDRRVNSLSLLVSVLDWEDPSTLGSLLTRPADGLAGALSSSRGVLGGDELGRLFAWLRPNDLVWNYWVNNYLMGRRPPAFDVLAWNADGVNLPAGLHKDFLAVAADNALSRPGGLEVLGRKVDLAAVTCDAYVIAGETDHITPWTSCYRTTRLLGGPTEFVLCASGHVQTIVCPPDNPKARYLVNPDRPEQAEAWRAGAETRTGSWWGHWTDWLGARAGTQAPARAQLGSAAHPPLGAAPGDYVRGAAAAQ
ncbi:MAG: PHA/PHB synthase family protein [Acidimicrobiales bacterium]